MAGWYGEFDGPTITLRLHIGLSDQPSPDSVHRHQLTFGDRCSGGTKATKDMSWLRSWDTENYGRPYGNTTWFEFYPRENHDIIDFHGRSGDYLDAIGAVCRRLNRYGHSRASAEQFLIRTAIGSWLDFDRMWPRLDPPVPGRPDPGAGRQLHRRDGDELGAAGINGCSHLE